MVLKLGNIDKVEDVGWHLKLTNYKVPDRMRFYGGGKWKISIQRIFFCKIIKYMRNVKKRSNFLPPKPEPDPCLCLAQYWEP